MAYKNPVLPILASFYTNLSGISVPVYKVTADPAETGNYVLIRPEGQNMTRNHSAWFTTVVVIVDIVTKFNEVVDTGVCDTIDNEIVQFLMPDHSFTNISGGVNHQVTDITIGSSSYNTEYDGTNVWYIKSTRYEIKVNQRF